MRNNKHPNNENNYQRIAQILTTKLLRFFEEDEYKTIVLISNQGNIRILDGQSRKVLATFSYYDINNGKFDHYLKTIQKRKTRNKIIFDESNALRNKLLELQNHADELYSRISSLEQIERKYYLLMRESEQQTPQVYENDINSGYSTKIEVLQKKVARLRRENFVLREGDEKECSDELNSISYFEHRLRNAVISQLYTKIIRYGFDEHDNNCLRKFTTRELIELNNAEPKLVIELLLETKHDNHLLRRLGVERLLKNINRQFEIEHIILAHTIENQELIEKLKYFTNNALKFFNMLPLNLQKELLEKLNNCTQPRIWNGAFIKGYYFLYNILEYSTQGKHILHDLKFSVNNDVKILFKETLYEIFGNFVFIEKNHLYVISGIIGMANMLKEMKQQSVIKGIFGELVAAYYYKKAYEMEILEFQKRIETSTGTVGEIDIIALDKNNILWDIEVKNWSVTSIAATETLVRKVTDQLQNKARKKFLEQLKTEYENIRNIKIATIKRRAILVKDTPYKSHIAKIKNDPSILIEVIDLVPEWLTKGIYNPII
ncbi:MAG: hypothetical protein DKM50_10180 [Candidatus Margulisiibacteriota bacterium]|nr:MAG: hypothetical protein A2X43_04265 [Candidatus Margulisbacteria bacterium GWD2_39_127]OGI05213.1 MAG: hypothetical protein A2X42_02775 [Candidatus Margulisbacteria bacterium GWF2_38_17]OGI06262.1 MAG: hypothetical protein A2X41_08355 [Candidatus Margulisbacteria bacterium GWE2_39_32]PZM78919.1 MAG: hypothetical protein DKM50_10180 [Candidatus Margulisiibacteriota bacterium]HAR64497.1 hypothetical protein [Candidatus Margulisiibacteriota bacterium]